jgi:hypothetical protein
MLALDVPMTRYLRSSSAAHGPLLRAGCFAFALAAAPWAHAVTTPPPTAPGVGSAPPESDRGAVEAGPPSAEPKAGHGPQTVFYRADDLAALHAMTFAASYGVESGEHLTETTKAYGIKHKLQAAFGATEWLKLSVEQNMKRNGNTGELRVGVFAPQLRLTLRGMLPSAVGRWPLDVSAFFGPRIRIQGRREPSVVAGFGSNTPRGPFHFTVNQGLEVTRANPEKGLQSEFGPRYDLGVGYELGLGFVAEAEVWGHMAWSRGGYAEQEHHAGPSLLLVYRPVRFALGGATGWRDERGTKLWDVSGMLTAGLEI